MRDHRAISPWALFVAAVVALSPTATAQTELVEQPVQTTETKSVEMSTGETNKPIEVTELRLQPVKSVSQSTAVKSIYIPGAYTLSPEDYKGLPIAKTNRELKVKKLGVANGDTIVLFSLRDCPDGECINTPDNSPLHFEPCDSFKVEDDESINVRPVNVFCNQTGYLVDGGLVALQLKSGGYAPIAQIPQRKAPVMGTDAGIALTIMKDYNSGKGYEFFEGATGYYSLARLKSPIVRLVANLSALDMDPEQDFETGLGLGILLRPPGALDDSNNMGLGFVIGGGYNFMLDSGRNSAGEKKEPWYWFVGFSWNFDRASS